MATIFQQKSKALNLFSPDETQRFKLSTVDSGFGREAIIDYNGGAGVVQFPGPLVYVHQGMRYALGETISSARSAIYSEVTRAQTAEATIQAAVDSEVTRAQAAEAGIQATLIYETESRSANIVDIQGSLAYLNNRADTLSEQHVYTNGRIDAADLRATTVEQSLQTQISALLSNTDSVALNSLSELVVDYRENGMGAATTFANYQTSNDAALAAALARINLLETFIVSLQDTTSGAGD